MVTSVCVRAATPAPATYLQATSLPEYRIVAFCTAVAARLRAGASLATVAREQQAIIAALGNPNFARAMAVAFAEEMKTQNPNPDYAVPLKDAELQIAGVLKNRIHDAQQFLVLLATPSFVAHTQEHASRPADPVTPYQLPAEKNEEIIENLLPNKEPLIHVAGTANGQRQLHQALANLFKPEGVLRALLIHTLALSWPEASAAQLENLAGNWLKGRHDAAHSVAKGLAPDGPLYAEAMKRVSGNAVPQPLPIQPIDTPPSPQATMPAVFHAKPLANPALVMDGI